MDLVEWARALFALVATLALIGLAAFGARRFKMIENLASRTAAPRRMRVVERLLLDPRRSLVLVEIDGVERTLLLSPFGDKELERPQ
jgi:flagellar protein FliO/FliZ